MVLVFVADFRVSLIGGDNRCYLPKKYELLHNLKYIITKILIYSEIGMKLYENYMKWV